MKSVQDERHQESSMICTR